MRDRNELNLAKLESPISESDLGSEIIDMLAQANIDFRRLPVHELQDLIATAQPKTSLFRRRAFSGSTA